MSTVRADNFRTFDGVGKAPFTVNTIAELRTLAVVEGMKVEPVGYYAAGDGGGGPIRVAKTGAAAGTYVDNGGSIIVPTGGDGSSAWVMEWSGAYDARWFGAVGDGTTDNTTVLRNALATGVDLYIPYTANGFSFTGLLTVSTIGQSIFGDGYGSWLKPATSGGNTLALDADNTSVRNIRFEGSAAGVIKVGSSTSRKNIEVKDNYFKGVGQCVWFFAAEHVQVVGNHFEECGYQVIQQLGYTSNYVTVSNNTSFNCNSDFVELNCERDNPSYNWTITGNTVTSVGMRDAPNADGTTKTESRFVGATMVDGIIISNNTVDGVAGDSPIHLERPGATIISGNKIRNGNGASGAARFIYLLPSISNLPAGWESRQQLTITDNIFETTEATLTGGTARWINTGAVSDSSKIVIKDNHFLNYGASYPSDPTPFDLAINISFTLGEVIIEGNNFRNFSTGVNIDNTQGGSQIKKYYAILENNVFYNTTTPLNVTSTGNLSSFVGNSMDNCEMPVLSNRPKIMGNNVFRNMTVTGFATQRLAVNDFTNIYDNTTHDDAREGIVATNGVATNLFKLYPRCSLIVSVIAERVGAANNNRRQIFFVSNRFGTFQATSLGTQSAGTAPTITLTGTGTNDEQVQVTITDGGGVDHTVRADISGIDT